MSHPVLFVSQFQIAKGEHHMLLSLSSPSGSVRNGKVETQEIARIALTPELFRELAAACGNAANLAPARSQREEQRSYDPVDDASPEHFAAPGKSKATH